MTTNARQLIAKFTFIMGMIGLSSCQGHDPSLANSALVRVVGGSIDVRPFGGQRHVEIPNPRGESTAYFSADGRFVAWNYWAFAGSSDGCPSPIIVEATDRSFRWQLPGNVINIHALALSPDGRRVAFDGLLKPSGTGVLNIPQNNSRWISGLLTADFNTRTISRVLATYDGVDHMTVRHIGAIGWAPDSKSFAYDYNKQVYIYDILSGTSRPVIAGEYPQWSPDGALIAFRSVEGKKGYAVDLRTGLSKELTPGHAVLGWLHWSPDSAYIMFVDSLIPGFEPTMRLETYRLRDGSNRSMGGGSLKGISDRAFYWINDYEAFLKTALIDPIIQPCDSPDPDWLIGSTSPD